MLKVALLLLLMVACFAAGYLCRRKNPTDPKVTL